MGNQSKQGTCRPKPDTRVWLDDNEHDRCSMRTPADTNRPQRSDQRDRLSRYPDGERKYPNATPPRPRHPRSATWVTQPILRTRGWTDTAIRKFLPTPESHRRNPYRRGRNRPMPLWSPETVARIEATAEWQDWLEKSLHRRKTTLRKLKPNPGLVRHTRAAQSAIDHFRRIRR